MRIFVVLVIGLVSLANCSVLYAAQQAAADGMPTVSALSQEWLEIKTLLLKGADDTGGAVSPLLDRFSNSLARFFASPVQTMYQTQPVDRALRLKVFAANTGEMTAALKTAVEQGDQAAVFARIADIDAVLTGLQQIEIQMADNAQLSYFRLFLFFGALIFAVIVLLAAVHRKMEKALARERQSRSFSRETILAQEEERSRIARELHDSVAQDIWRLSVQVSSLQTSPLQAGGTSTADEDERRRLCAEVAAGHQTLLEQLRRICGELVPPDFRHQGLPAALRGLCHNFEKRTGIECRLTIQENLRMDGLDLETQLQCFRLVQEALANIEKHSLSPEAVVVLRNGVSGNSPALLLCVSDSGTGFAVPPEDSRPFSAEGHFGLRNMRERAAIVSGSLTIDSEIGEGTTITLAIPLIVTAQSGEGYK